MATSRLLTASDSGHLVRFDFTTTSLTLQALAVGQIVEFAAIVIETAFDDEAATIELGTAAHHGAILQTSEVVPSVEGQYESDQLLTIVVPELLLLTINPGDATVGSGFLLYRIRS